MSKCHRLACALLLVLLLVHCFLLCRISALLVLRVHTFAFFYAHFGSVTLPATAYTFVDRPPPTLFFEHTGFEDVQFVDVIEGTLRWDPS